jgi:pilus assembly protein CpaC
LFPGIVIDFVDRLGADATVYIDARIVEFRRSTLRDLGVRWRSDVNGPNAGVLADLIVSDDYRPTAPDPSAPAMPASRERIWPPRGYLGLSTTLDPAEVAAPRGLSREEKSRSRPSTARDLRTSSSRNTA